jgi:RNA polymerase sigma-70 factor (ECF subfamily)
VQVSGSRPKEAQPGSGKFVLFQNTLNVIHVSGDKPYMDPVETMQVEESDLIARAWEGDAEAYAQLIKPLESRLLRQARGLSRDREIAFDLAQETLAEGWRCIRRFNGRCKLSTWLYAILLKRFRKYCKKRRRWPISFSFFEEDQPPEAVDERLPDAEQARHDDAALLHRAIDYLPQTQQQVIRLRFFDESSIEEVAAALGCRPGTVKSRLHYGLKRMKKILQKLEPNADLGGLS